MNGTLCLLLLKIRCDNLDIISHASHVTNLIRHGGILEGLNSFLVTPCLFLLLLISVICE